jgi:hypothetical protein
MIKSTGLLFVLSAAMAANAELAPTSEISNALPPALMFAAAGGHDSVGGLMPLSLWPPYTPRIYAPVPREWKRRSRRCIANSCSH